MLNAYNGVLEILERQAFDIIVCDYIHNKETIREDFHRKNFKQEIIIAGFFMKKLHWGNLIIYGAIYISEILLNRMT